MFLSESLKILILSGITGFFATEYATCHEKFFLFGTVFMGLVTIYIMVLQFATKIIKKK